jgi:hypothetical protein
MGKLKSFGVPEEAWLSFLNGGRMLLVFFEAFDIYYPDIVSGICILTVNVMVTVVSALLYPAG